MKKLQIAYFGVNEKSGKNAMTLSRLQNENIAVSDVSVEIKTLKMDDESDLKFSAIVGRIITKLKIVPKIFTHFGLLKKSDVILVCYPGHLDLPLAWLVAKILNKPLVFDHSNFLVDVLTVDVGILNKQSLLSKLMLVFEKFVYRLPDLMLVDTEVIKKHLVKYFDVAEEKVEVVYLGADENIYKYSKLATTSTSKITVLYYGMYNQIHGVEHMIDAAKILQKNKNVTFIMVGSGRHYQQATERAKKYNLKNIIFYPAMQEKDAQKILRDADIFLGFMQKSVTLDRFIPNKVAQGVALGKAVITAESEAIKSVFSNKENIYLCEAENPESLAAAINHLESDRKLLKKIAQNGYELFNKKLSMKAVGVYLHTLLQRVSNA